MSGFRPLTSIDGEITRTVDARLPLPDDGLLRGDGVFEVLRCYAGRPFAFRDHLDRMNRSAAAIELDLDRSAIAGESEALLAANGTEGCLLRIVVTRAGRRVISLEPLPVHSGTITLATIAYSPTRILNDVKSLAYAANMQATRLAKRTGADEALLVNPEGIVLEAPTSTFFWVSADGPLRTTATDAGVLQSITRAKIIERVEVELGRFPIGDAITATEAFLASTTREIQPVAMIDGLPIATSPAPRTAAAKLAFKEALAADLDSGFPESTAG